MRAKRGKGDSLLFLLPIMRFIFVLLALFVAILAQTPASHAGAASVSGHAHNSTGAPHHHGHHHKEGSHEKNEKNEKATTVKAK
ncbi:hypothetical protein PRIPAC_72332 [Pristionchus pacificus]|uniref:Uncharacterized protein n=1 Tax=Pristionchus pacificus TaxID=54126 RepID=A0A454Y2D6_PRIPA|nr:hypothetical protein PRIPAC_72332 [Pristionchus pacificus]|eukprot:PDM83568.1 hypothetical protein PRIPAC_30055 [Pristionchus pacificus]